MYAIRSYYVLLTAVGLGYYLLKKNKILFPKLSLYITNNFYSILLRIFLIIGTEDTFYKVASEFYNKYYCEEFKKAKNKVLILPHCLRDLKCPGKLGPDGVECIFCGKCPIGEIIKVARITSYNVCYTKLLRHGFPDRYRLFQHRFQYF